MARPVQRHYGMDWLRIGAFAILILYHIGMVFVPWGFHVKLVPVERWATLPMLAVNAWRLTLLFVVSGYASRALLRRSAGPGGFLRDRSWRLLVPLAFGVAVIVPPQSWVELASAHGYRGDFPSFWLRDYWRFDRIGGVGVPSWNHLWFVAYLWVYTALLAGVAATLRALAWQQAFERLFGGWLVLLVPLAWLSAIHARWFPMVGESHALVGDWIAHMSYLPAFVFGVGLAGSPRTLGWTARHWPVTALLALGGYGWIAATELGWTGPFTPDRYVGYGLAHAAQQWGAILALIGLAERFLNRDTGLRPVLTEAVFPFYLVHQTIIVVVGYALLRSGTGGAPAFAVLVVTTVAGCAAFYLIGRRIGPLRPLIGLRRHPRPAPAIL